MIYNKPYKKPLSEVGAIDEEFIDTIAAQINNKFETVSKNLNSYPYVLVYGIYGLSTITYNLGGGNYIVKTFNYTLGVLTSIVLSGDIPSGIEHIKTFHYTGNDLTSITYS
jgi:hypothetical protein